MKIIFDILWLIGFMQVVFIFISIGSAMGRLSEINKWKMIDFLWSRKIEQAIVEKFRKDKVPTNNQ